jgi:carbamoyltransferase
VNILGISAFYHDSAACLVRDGEIMAAAQEERFTQKKHDESFPRNAIDYCLAEAGLAGGAQPDLVAFYEKPFLKCDRLFSTYLAVAPRGLPSFLKAVPVLIKQKIWIKEIIRKELGFDGQILFPEHHESHAASAFFPSPFPEAAILSVDGVGEWTTTSIGRGEENRVGLLHDLQFPHSLGLLYSTFTQYLGFRVNSGEYKVMGLAPYGQPRFVDLILSELIDLKQDGSFRLNLDYCDFVAGLSMTNQAFVDLLGSPARQPEAELTAHYMDVARSIQAVTDEAMLRMARQAHALVGGSNLCLAGGVALNCVANSGILRAGPFENIWIQPAAGDAGGAIGAALVAWHHHCGKPREACPKNDRQHASLLGPSYQPQEFLMREKIPHTVLTEDELMSVVVTHLNQGKVIGWYQGRMEFGPRALGNRSILADARHPDMQKKLNLKIKFRESFRPFAPAVLLEKVADYFDFSGPSPYMLFTAPVKAASTKIPAVTHVDGSARLQTVAAEDNPRFHRLLREFERHTGCAVLVNTSFNVRGEPPVCDPQDAWRCFRQTDIDYLVLDNCLLDKHEQPAENPRPRSQPANWLSYEYEKIDHSPRSLRRFGYTMGFILLLLGSVFINSHRTAGWSLLLIGLLLLGTAPLAPSVLRYFDRGWTYLALFLGWLMTRIILTMIFVLAVTPIGLIQRAFGKRPLELRFRTPTSSYWRARKQHDVITPSEEVQTGVYGDTSPDARAVERYLSETVVPWLRPIFWRHHPRQKKRAVSPREDRYPLF